MATGITAGGAPQKSSVTSYSELFKTAVPREDQVILAVGRLAIALDHPIRAEALLIWAQNLAHFQPQQLVLAFSTAEKTLEAWPTPAKVLGIIFDSEFRADYAWLAENVRRHGPHWARSAPTYSEYKRGPDAEMTRELIDPGDLPPEIPPRLRRTLELFQDGTIEAGLEAFFARPSAKPTEETGWTASPARHWFDQSFRAAWQQARNEELAK